MPFAHPRTLLVTLLAGLLTLPWAAVSTARPALAADCADLTTDVLGRARSSAGDVLLTPWAGEAAGAADYGFDDDLGTVFRAALGPADGLVAVHRVYRQGRGFDFVTADRVPAAVADGASDQGVRFYAAAASAPCLMAVQRWSRGGVARLAPDGAAPTGDGWSDSGPAFWVRPASAPSAGLVSSPLSTVGGTSFTFAVVPDTQMEVVKPTDRRMLRRSQFLLSRPRLAFALQTGDLVNWDTADHGQYRVAKTGLAPLERAGVPYTVAVGNHDNLATGVGGSARDPRRSHTLLRDTDTLNAYFDTSDFRGVGGTFEPGKIDNLYTLYRAGGLKWMVLSLEFCPRKAVVAWARQVVAAHPDYNVIVSTHYYLSKSGAISTSAAGYGDTSGRYLWTQLVSRYPNVKLVFSGHTGKARKARVDTGARGNKVYSFLTTMHDRKSNPVRLVSIDVGKRTLATRVYAPDTRHTWTAYTQTLKGLTFVR